MLDYTILYPTWGDLAREQVRRRDLYFFGDVQQDVKNRLTKMPPVARKAFALSCAERLMSAYERLPAAMQSPFTLSWRPVLDEMWAGLAEEQLSAIYQAQMALDAFHSSPYNHKDGPDGPQDAGEDTAAASIYTVECYISGDVQAAYWTSARVIDAAFDIGEDDLQLDRNNFEWDPNAEPMPFAQEAMHSAVQIELQRQLRDIALLEQHGVTSNVLEQLKRSDQT
jgi:hypothetical protein